MRKMPWTSALMIPQQAKGARFVLKMKRPTKQQDARIRELVRLRLHAALDAASIVASLERALGDEVALYVEIIHFDPVRES